MAAGEYNKQITLQKPVKSRNSFNAMETTYSDVATVWAAVEWGSGKRFTDAKALNADVQGVIRIRYRTDVKASWRIKYGNRTIEILSLSNPRERGRELLLWCREAKK